jgi:Protein of unknown function (DUF3365)
MFIVLFFAFTAGGISTSPGAHPGPHVGPTDTLALFEASRAAAKDFLTTLKGILVSQLAARGPVHAVTVCADTAQELQRKVEQRHELYMRRVSSRWRSRLDMPDAYEQKKLVLLEELSRTGSLSERTELYEDAEGDSVRYFRYMKPIVV